MFLILSILLHSIKSQLYNSAFFSPGANLLINPIFSTPNIGGNWSQLISGGIPGWPVATVQLVTISSLCSTYGNVCSYSYIQGMDLDIATGLIMLSQSITINSTNQYLLSIGWI